MTEGAGSFTGDFKHGGGPLDETVRLPLRFLVGSVDSPFFLMVVLFTVHSSGRPQAQAICVVPIAAKS